MKHLHSHLVSRFATCLVACLGLAAGCAKGSDGDPVTSPDPTDAASLDETVGPQAPDAADAGRPDTEGPIDAGKADTQAEPDAGAIACDAPKPCEGAQDLGEVRGDRGLDTREASGTTSQWLRVLVKQPSTSPWGDSTVTLTLDSPPGANFDLFTHLGPVNSGPAKCSGVADGASTHASGTDSVHLQWPETLSDDTRWLTIEVRHVSGTCRSSAPWKLKVAGNQ